MAEEPEPEPMELSAELPKEPLDKEFKEDKDVMFAEEANEDDDEESKESYGVTVVVVVPGAMVGAGVVVVVAAPAVLAKSANAKAAFCIMAPKANVR